MNFLINYLPLIVLLVIMTVVIFLILFLAFSGTTYSPENTEDAVEQIFYADFPVPQKGYLIGFEPVINEFHKFFAIYRANNEYKLVIISKIISLENTIIEKEIEVSKDLFNSTDFELVLFDLNDENVYENTNYKYVQNLSTIPYHINYLP